MSAPVIEGQSFPDYEFKEYPKALYPHGQANNGDGAANRPFVATDAEHEAELKAEHGDLELAPLEGVKGEGDEPDAAPAEEAPAGEDTQSGAETGTGEAE